MAGPWAANEMSAAADERGSAPSLDDTTSVPSKSAAEPALRDLLKELQLDSYWPRLCAEVGVECAEDFQYVREADLEALGMRPVPRRKLLHLAALRFGQADAEDEEDEYDSTEEDDALLTPAVTVGSRRGAAVPRTLSTRPLRKSSGSQVATAPSPSVKSANQALLRAVLQHSLEGIKSSLDAGADIEFPDDKYNQTPLVWACEKSTDEVVELLLERGASVNVPDENGYTALQHAIRSGLKLAPNLLLKAGADVAAANTFGVLPLHQATKYNRPEAARLLLSHGADVNAVVTKGDAETALHFAAGRDNAELAALLIEAGADVSKVDAKGNTPLHEAAYSGSMEVAELLMQHGATLSKNKKGRTPVHVAADSREAAVLGFFLEQSCGAELMNEPSGEDDRCSAPLHLAATSANLECVEKLVSAGAAVNLPDKAGNTPLHLAAKTASGTGELSSLVNAAATTEGPEMAARLRSLAKAEGERIITALINAGADISLRNKAGKVAMDFATTKAAKLALKREATRELHVDFAAWLAEQGFDGFRDELLRLGISRFVDLRHLREDDVDEFGLSLIEQRRFMDAAKQKIASLALTNLVVPAIARPMQGECNSSDVMISYRVSETGDGGDRSVFALADALRANGYSVFVGESAIQAGDIWPRTVQEGVLNCRAFVVMCSTSYGDERVSPWTFREIALADNQMKPIIPVWHSGVYPPPAVSIYLGHKHRVPSGTGDMRSVAIATVVEELIGALQRADVWPLPGQQEQPSTA